MAIKTANKCAYLRGEGEERAKYGLSLVVVNSRQGGCPDCAKYIGRAFIDDVYSNGKKSDGDYPLLSTAIAEGLFHPRCKDSTSTHYPELDDLSGPLSDDELAELDRQRGLEVQQQHAEKQAERFDRKAKYSLDEDNKKFAKARADEWHDRADRLEEKAKKEENSLPESVAKSADNDIIKTESRDYSAVGFNAFSDSAKQKLLQDERILSDNDYETAVIYNPDGSRKFSKKGTSEDVKFTNKQIAEMKGCVLTHNHPNGTVFFSRRYKYTSQRSTFRNESLQRTGFLCVA